MLNNNKIEGFVVYQETQPILCKNIELLVFYNECLTQNKLEAYLVYTELEEN